MGILFSWERESNRQEKCRTLQDSVTIIKVMLVLMLVLGLPQTADKSVFSTILRECFLFTGLQNRLCLSSALSEGETPAQE